jgi:hypothetical protein
MPEYGTIDVNRLTRKQRGEMLYIIYDLACWAHRGKPFRTRTVNGKTVEVAVRAKEFTSLLEMQAIAADFIRTVSLPCDPKGKP